METMTLATLMESIGTMFTEAISWIGEVAAAIGGHPILLFCFLLPVIGLGVGLFKRISHI